MEIKKSIQVDLEGKRTTGFLLGLILALSLIFVGLQYTTSPDDSGADEDALEDMAQDMEILHQEDQKDMISVEPTAGAASKAITEKVKAVNQQPQSAEKISPNTGVSLDANAEGDGKEQKGEVASSNITTALPQPLTSDDNPYHFRVVEQLPEFPGGWVELMKYLHKNLKYPALAEKQNIQGKVVISFIINKDGTMADIKVSRSVDPLLDREALRVVKAMPKWKPGVMYNKPCRTLFAIPVVFKI